MLFSKLFLRFITCVFISSLSWSCIDLNDFDRISKNVEFEASLPIYNTKIYLDTLVKQSASFLKTNSVGVYYLEQKTSTYSSDFTRIPFDYTFTYQNIQFGPFLTISDRLTVQQELYDNGLYVSNQSGPLSINSISNNLQAQIKSLQVVKGKLIINIENTFNKLARVNLVYKHLVDSKTSLSLTRRFDITPLAKQKHVVDISGYSLDLSKGAVGYNQMDMDVNITIDDPSATSNATNSIVGSLNKVVVENAMDIDSAINVYGAFPSLVVEPNLSADIDIPPLSNVSAFGSEVEVMSSVLALNISSNAKVPLSLKIQSLTAHFVDGSVRSIPSKNPDHFFEISSPAAVDGIITSQIIIDNSVVDDKLLRETLYNPDISKISLVATVAISPVKASLKDSIEDNTKFDFNFSIYAPMRVDVNGLTYKDVSFDNSDFISQLKRVILQQEITNVSRAVFALTFYNYMPFDLYPQVYLYKSGSLIDSVITSSDGDLNNVFIEGAPIDYNGFVVNLATPREQTLLVDIDKKRWDKIMTADASVSKFSIYSVKSAKVPYVFLKNDQYFQMKIKLRKLVFSTKVF